MGLYRKKTKTEAMQEIVRDYIAAGEPWPAPRKAIAEWAVKNKRYTRAPKSIVDICAQELADAMRQEMERDPQGRLVHAKHCAKIQEDDGAGNLVQKTLWFDNQTRTYELMRMSQQQWRNSILGECRQHRIEEESFNDNSKEGKKLQMPLNFEPDLLDSQHGTEYDPPPPPADDEEV